MPNYTYNSNIPAATDNPSTSQGQMQTNCNSVESILDVDLIGFGDNDGGYHQKSTYVVQGSDPGSASGQVVEYSKTANSSSELFIQRDNVSTVIQMTSGLANAGTTAPFGQSFLPGGFQIKWGVLTPVVSGANAITYVGVGLSNFPTNTVNISLSVGKSGSTPAANYGSDSLALTGFTAYYSGSVTGVSIYWTAIGY